jgi:hypothetical protein
MDSDLTLFFQGEPLCFYIRSQKRSKEDEKWPSRVRQEN